MATDDWKGEHIIRNVPRAPKDETAGKVRKVNIKRKKARVKRHTMTASPSQSRHDCAG